MLMFWNDYTARGMICKFRDMNLSTMVLEVHKNVLNSRVQYLRSCGWRKRLQRHHQAETPLSTYSSTFTLYTVSSPHHAFLNLTKTQKKAMEKLNFSSGKGFGTSLHTEKIGSRTTYLILCVFHLKQLSISVFPTINMKIVKRQSALMISFLNLQVSLINPHWVSNAVFWYS